MKKKLKKLFAMVLTGLVVLSAVTGPAYAAQPQPDVSPLYAVPISVDCGSSIDDDNVLYTTAAYDIGNAEYTRIKITIYVEKRSLLVLWNRVDIGQTNNQWVDYCYGWHNDVDHFAQMPSSGTYRVTTTFEVLNGSEVVETITKTTTVSN